MSPELQQFYDDIAMWIEDGCPPNRAFYPQYGLCSNLSDWYTHRSLFDNNLALELRKQFADADLDQHYPFDVDQEAYYNSKNSNYRYGCFTNEKRLNWVFEHTSKE